MMDDFVCKAVNACAAAREYDVMDYLQITVEIALPIGAAFVSGYTYWSSKQNKNLTEFDSKFGQRVNAGIEKCHDYLERINTIFISSRSIENDQRTVDAHKAILHEAASYTSKLNLAWREMTGILCKEKAGLAEKFIDTCSEILIFIKVNPQDGTLNRDTLQSAETMFEEAKSLLAEIKSHSENMRNCYPKAYTPVPVRQ